MNARARQEKNQVNSVNIFEQEELVKKAAAIRQGLQVHAWHDLETHGKFDKNVRLFSISDDILIAGCDIGSDTHYMRAIDTRRRELSNLPGDCMRNREGSPCPVTSLQKTGFGV